MHDCKKAIQRERRKVLEKAAKYRPGDVWQIKTPKRVLRCDICAKHKKKQAVYACAYTGQLYCIDHVGEAYEALDSKDND